MTIQIDSRLNASLGQFQQDLSTGLSTLSAKVDSITQALINYRISHLIKKEALEIPDDNIDRNAWKKGNLNNTYQFDFGTSYAYQIQLPKKLIQLERCFLDHEDQFGFVEAQLSANPTDIKLLDPTDTAIQKPKFASTTKVDIPDDLVALRQELFVLIKESATDEGENAGLTCTFDFAKNIAIVKNYLLSYTSWLNSLADQDLDEESLAEVSLTSAFSSDVSFSPSSLTSLKSRSSFLLSVIAYPFILYK